MQKVTITLVAVLATLCTTAQTKFYVCKNDGTFIEHLISETDSISFTYTPAVEKCKASDYAQVTIGTQTWMAENYRCSSYDTESEAYNASWLTNNTLPTSGRAVYTPYYTDATDKTKWYSTKYSDNLDGRQIASLGYLYNLAAAVGVENGHDYGTTSFSGNRQGICPNGWHVPTRAEWQILYDYIYNDKQLSDNTVGKYMKTTSGWYENGNGTDSYGFAALPSGHADGSSVGSVGINADFCTATPREYYDNSAYYRYLYYGYDNLDDYSNENYYGQSVRCVKNIAEAEILSVSPLSKDFESSGGTFDITVTSSTSWKVSSDQTWATPSVSTGSGNGTITVTVAWNTNVTDDVAIIELITLTGKKVSVAINRAGNPTKVTDICGNMYPVVTIGIQTWMAENYSCSKYDTESEAYNASWLTNNTISTSYSPVYTPYYTDATEKIKWSSTKYAGNLSDEQIAKLGYLYNWSAAIGVENGENQTTAFTGNRQGICPNGWHVPTRAEWQTLANYINGNNGLTNAGKKMKTTSGWYDGGNGTDSYGFAALPSAETDGLSVYLVGYDAHFWTATPSESDSSYAYYRRLNYYNDYLDDIYDGKGYGRSVRCLRD